MEPAALAVYVNAIRTLGIGPVALLLLAAAAVGLYRSNLQLMKDHRAEREADRSAHLDALGHLGEKVDDTRHLAERILDRVSGSGNGAGRALGMLALVALLAGCSHRSELHEQAQLATVARVDAVAVAHAHAAEELRAHAVKRTHRGARKLRRTVDRKVFVPAVPATASAPAVPAHVDETLTVTELEAAPVDATATQDTARAATRDKAEKQAQHEEGATAATVRRDATSETRVGFSLLGRLLLLTGVLAAGAAVLAVVKCGGPLGALAALGKLVRRLFSGAPQP